jgi:hypothetical protein
MPRNPDLPERKPPQGDYSHAPRNLRNFAEGKNLLPQGIITSNEQAIHNVEHIIKYLNSEAFDRKIQGMIDASIAKALAKMPSENKNNENNEEKSKESGESEG